MAKTGGARPGGQSTTNADKVQGSAGSIADKGHIDLPDSKPGGSSESSTQSSHAASSPNDVVETPVETIDKDVERRKEASKEIADKAMQEQSERKKQQAAQPQQPGKLVVPQTARPNDKSKKDEEESAPERGPENNTAWVDSSPESDGEIHEGANNLPANPATKPPAVSMGNMHSYVASPAESAAAFGDPYVGNPDAGNAVDYSQPHQEQTQEPPKQSQQAKAEAQESQSSRPSAPSVNVEEMSPAEVQALLDERLYTIHRSGVQPKKDQDGKVIETDEEALQRILDEQEKVRRTLERKALPNMEDNYRDNFTTQKEWDEYKAQDPNSEDFQDIKIKLPDKQTQEQRKLKKAQEKMRNTFLNPYNLKFTGERTEKLDNGAIVRVLPRETQGVIFAIQHDYACSFEDAVRIIMLRTGLGVDSKGNICNVAASEFALDPDFVMDVYNEIKDSQARFGHPFGLVPGPPLTLGGTRCYPIGYIPRMLERGITGEGSVISDLADSKLHEEVQKHWLSKTQPTIVANTKGDKISQRYAIDNMMRAMASLDGNEAALSTYFNVSLTMDRTLDQIKAERQAAVGTDMEDAFAERDRRASEAIARMRARNLREIVGPDGTIISSRGKKTKVGNGALAIANWMRFAGVVANPAVIIPGYIEHFTGTMWEKGANGIMAAYYKDPRFRMNSTLSDLAKTSEAKEAMVIVDTLLNVGGMDAVIAYFDTVGEVNGAACQKFLSEYVRGIEDATKRQRAGFAMNKFTRRLMPGSAGMAGFDSKRFMETFLLNQAQNARDGKVAMTANDVLEDARREGIGKAILRMASTTEGTDAVVAMNNLNLNRQSAWSYYIDRAMQKSGITNLVLTTALDTYVKYGFNAMQNFLPLSNTMAYLSIQGTSKDAEVRNYQMGGHDRFWIGLRKNLLYDAAKIANYGAIACLFGLVIAALGFEPPDDDDQKYNILAWKIGGNIGLGADTDGDGKGDGERFAPAWWLNDLVGWGLPLAVACNAWSKYPEDPMLGTNLFLDGMYRMVDGLSVMDAIEGVVHAKQNVRNLERSMQEQDWIAPEDWASWAWMEATSTIPATFLRKITPAFINNYWPGLTRDTLIAGSDARDRSSSKVYDTENFSPEEARELNRTKNVGSYEEQLQRSNSTGNVLYGMLMNFWHYGTPIVGNDSENTGFLFFEKPIATAKDQLRMASNPFNFSLDDPEIPQDATERKVYLEQQATNLINYMTTEFDSVEDAVYNGFMIGYDARVNATNFCYTQILNSYLAYADKIEQGMSYEESVKARADHKALCDYYYGIVDDWLKSDKLPWRDDGYDKLLSDWDKTYFDKDGNPINGFAYVFNPDATAEFKPLGNHPTSFSPFTMVDSNDRGYNAETISNWYREGITDTNAIFGQMEGVDVPYGRDEGKKVNKAIFGGQGDETVSEGDYHIEPGGQTTMGYRSYVPSEYAIPAALKDMSLEEIAAQQGVDLDALKDVVSNGSTGNTSGWNNNRAYYRRSSGGGGSSYNPKIYSISKSVTADKAQGMNVRQPYGATRSYLRPNFETKGSREAYKRSDI